MSYPETPPRRLSILSTDPHHHPCCSHVGVLFDGADRRDVVTYDVDTGRIEVVRGEPLTGTVEPYWRKPRNRQQLRRWARYDEKHGAPE